VWALVRVRAFALLPEFVGSGRPRDSSHGGAQNVLPRSIHPRHVSTFHAVDPSAPSSRVDDGVHMQVENGDIRGQRQFPSLQSGASALGRAGHCDGVITRNVGFVEMAVVEGNSRTQMAEQDGEAAGVAGWEHGLLDDINIRPGPSSRYPRCGTDVTSHS